MLNGTEWLLNMLAAERHEYIVRLVNERGSARVTELAALCRVTEETIRRDLDRLEEAGRLKRSHGGAVSLRELDPSGGPQEIPYYEREVTRAEEKRRIAEEAVKKIRPGEHILLDGSSTAWYVARILPDMPLTVLTTSLRAAAELGSRERIEVLSTGGLMSHRSLSFVGPLAERALDDFHVDKAFISCKGIHLERGISESTGLQAQIKRKMAAIADHVYLLADASKFGVQEFVRALNLDAVHTIITDRGLDEETAASYRALGIEVTVV